MDKYIVIDVETTATDPWNGELVCVAWQGPLYEQGWVSETVPDRVREALADPTIAIVSHTLFDPRWFKLSGFDVAGPIINTQVPAHLINENTELSLEALAKIYLDQDMDKRLVRENKTVYFTADDGTKSLIGDAPIDQVMHYCLRDVETTKALYLTLLSIMDKGQWLPHWREEEIPFTGVLLDMECAGLPINLDQSAELRNKLAAERDEAEQACYDYLGYQINLGSWQQIGQVMFNKVWQEKVQLSMPGGKEQRDCYKDTHDHDDDMVCCWTLPAGFETSKVGRLYVYGTQMRKGLGLAPTPLNDSKTAPSTSTPTLLVYHGNDEFVKRLIHWRKLNKVITTYLDVYPQRTKDGRLYGRFSQTGTVTWRLSSSGPNLQNQPARGSLGHDVRSLFQGSLVVGDHSQLEPRLMAHFSGDPVLQEVYRERKDLYLAVAAYIFGRQVEKHEEERFLCKTLILALGYGAGAEKLAEILALNGFWTPVDRAKEYLDHLESLFSTFFGWKDHIHDTSKDRGYVVTLGGHIRRLRWAYGSAKWKIRTKAERQAINSIIQGSAADILRRNMRHCKGMPGLTLLAQVHDELIWEWDENKSWHLGFALDRIKVECEDPGYDLSVPLLFEPAWCNSWADKGEGAVILEENDADGT